MTKGEGGGGGTAKREVGWGKSSLTPKEIGMKIVVSMLNGGRTLKF